MGKDKVNDKVFSRDFINGAKTLKELVKRLKAHRVTPPAPCGGKESDHCCVLPQDFSGALSNLEQGEQNGRLDVCAKVVAKENYLLHKTDDVKSLAACCVADIVRIYAPESPFTVKDNEVRLAAPESCVPVAEPARVPFFPPFLLVPNHCSVPPTSSSCTMWQRILQAFMVQFEGLSDQSSAGYERSVYVLERFTEAKAYRDMLEEEDNEPLCILLAGFFRTIRSRCRSPSRKCASDSVCGCANHSRDTAEKVRNLMAEVTVSCLDEVDSLTSDVLDIVISALSQVPAHRAPCRSSCALSLRFCPCRAASRRAISPSASSSAATPRPATTS